MQSTTALDRIRVIPGYLTPTACASLIARMADLPTDAAHSYDPQTRTTRVDETRVCRIVQSAPVDDELQALMHRIVQHEVEPFYGVQVEAWEGPSVLVYEPGGHFAVHSDGGDDDAAAQGLRRSVSVVLYLNDDFAGGSLEFVQHGLVVQPETGMLVTFPSTAAYLHGVKPITSGTRWTLVSFLHAQG